MEFRHSAMADMDTLLTFARQGQEYFRGQGIPQWINGYPGLPEFTGDIERGWSHLVIEDGMPIGSFALSFDGEPTYAEIFEGNWRTDGDYAVIHRAVVDASRKGSGVIGSVFDYAIQCCRERGVKTLRCDTHECNTSMRRAMEKKGFCYCGIIHLDSGAPRVAYDLIIGEDQK